MAQHFKDLIVGQKAVDLVTDVYRTTESFPKREVYSLTDQIRRAGQAQFGRAEFSHFLSRSMGSLAQLETQLLIADRLEYTGQDQIQALLKQVIEAGKLLSGLINSLKKQL